MTNTFAFDRDGFEHELKSALTQSRIAFLGRYRDELNALAGLSEADIRSIAPNDLGALHYDELITVVKEASRANLEQAELRNQIVRLGSIAVALARKVPRLAELLG
jgi:hypothetical protein